MEEPLRKLGPYKLIRKIGRGAFGVVWLAEKQTAITATQVALKLPRDEDIDLEAFKQEAAIWVQASGHENVVSLIEADIYDEQVVIVSEYVPDGSLGAWLKQHGGKAPSIESACKMMDGVLSGLAHLHERRIIHRDLKPDNILLRRDTPMLADFGIARLLRSGSSSITIAGTPAYMGPEAFDGKRNERTDIWAVGVIFYQLLSGGLPYPQPDHASLIGAITRSDPPPVPESLLALAPLQRVVTKALQRDPAQRYASAAEMRNDLREAERLRWVNEHQAREAQTVLNERAEAALTMKRPDTRTLTESMVERPTPVALVAGERPSDDEKTRVAEAAKRHPNVKGDRALSTNYSQVTSVPSSKQSSRRAWVIAAVIVPVIVIPFLGVLLWIGVYLWTSSGGQPPNNTNSSEPQPLSRQPVSPPAGPSMTNKIGMQFVQIPAGTFTMGSNSTEGYSDEHPHLVTIARPFILGKYEVTQAQWKAVMGNDNPSEFKGDTLPVETVTWDDAQSFIEKLNELQDGFSYRLPREEEWEYACRATTTGDYAGDLKEMAWFKGNSSPKTHAVGGRNENGWGLYDMLGNVSEWCEDVYEEGPAIAGRVIRSRVHLDPHREVRVVRGGSWHDDPWALRSAARDEAEADDKASSLGFRVVAVARPQ